MSEKSTSIAMILSILFTGIGIAYLGNTKKGLGLFAIGLICSLLARFVIGLFNYLAFFLWIASIYLTYKEIKSYNQSPTHGRELRRTRESFRRQPQNMREEYMERDSYARHPRHNVREEYMERDSYARHPRHNVREVHMEGDSYDRNQHHYVKEPYEAYREPQSNDRIQTHEREPYIEKQNYRR